MRERLLRNENPLAQGFKLYVAAAYALSIACHGQEHDAG